MVPEDGPVDGDDHVAVVHLLEEGGDAGGGHEPCPPADGLHDVPERREVLLRGGVDAQLGQHLSGAGVVAYRVGLDLGGVAAVEAAPLEQQVGVLSKVCFESLLFFQS